MKTSDLLLKLPEFVQNGIKEGWPFEVSKRYLPDEAEDLGKNGCQMLYHALGNYHAGDTLFAANCIADELRGAGVHLVCNAPMTHKCLIHTGPEGWEQGKGEGAEVFAIGAFTQAPDPHVVIAPPTPWTEEPEELLAKAIGLRVVVTMQHKSFEGRLTSFSEDVLVLDSQKILFRRYVGVVELPEIQAPLGAGSKSPVPTVGHEEIKNPFGASPIGVQK